MSAALAELAGLPIDFPAPSTFALPRTWPPEGDYPIIVDRAGNAVSRYGESIWDLSCWDGRNLKLNFGDGPTRRTGARLSPANGSLLRQVVAWWLLGPNSVSRPRTLENRFQLLKPVFALCSQNGIAASELARFPRVVEQIPRVLAPSTSGTAFSLLHGLALASDSLGFELLRPDQIARLAATLPPHQHRQTPYIPPRIWSYQVRRLRECLDDFLAHEEQIKECFRFCLAAYEENASSPAGAYTLKPYRLPFVAWYGKRNATSRTGIVNHGAFRLTAQRFGIHGLLGRWVDSGDASGISAFSSYMSLISHVGIAYILNFSLMRIDEGAQIRASCHSIERDQTGEDIHLIGGITTKTDPDADARWIVSPSVESAVRAMSIVARLRIEAGMTNPAYGLTEDQITNPLLLSRPFEPWGSARNVQVRRKATHYPSILWKWPKLFDPNQLRITAGDLRTALVVSPDLDPDVFYVGAQWTLAWHQLRRTGAVNMLATGMVSDASLQYQLKHLSRAMSRYYGRNYYRLHATLDDETRGVYLREMYAALARDFDGLHAETIQSPHGDKRKAQILAEISGKDHEALVREAKSGRVSYRETFLGGCANPGPPCPLGGITNISGCMGHGEAKPCEWALLDKSKLPQITDLRLTLVQRLSEADPNSPLHESLMAQIESAERALHVLNPRVS